MAYIGKGPEQVLSGVASKSTFTGDGSTTTFDISTDIPAGGENDIQVFVDNVRQEPGSGASYTVGVDGSGNLRRITFNVAPEASQSIYILNPRRIEAFGQVPDNSIATAKLQDSSVTAAKISAIPNDSVNADKIADDAVSDEHLDVTTITDQTELAEAAASNDILLVYDASAGTLKKILASNVGTQAVTLSSVSPTNALSGDGTGNHTFTITGTNLTSASAVLITDGGTEVNFDSVTVDSSTQITAVIAKSSISNANEPYDVKVYGSNGLTAILRDQINVDASPTFVTASGSLGEQTVNTAGSFSVNATDPDSAGNVTFELQSGSLPPGYSLTNTAAEGGTAIISGTDSTTSSNTTYNFTLRAVDAASNTSSRSFSITSRVLTSESFTSSGTFSVPSGITSADVLVVAGGGGGGDDMGGGGGAGGLVFFPSYSVTPGGTITVTVGCGGAGTPGPDTPGITGQDSAFGSPGDPGLGCGGVLNAKGGGYGAGGPGQRAGGSGGSGGGGSHGNYTSPGVGPATGGPAIQPTQPGNSGAYGFGNAGGNGYFPGNPSVFIGGSGGGAGAAGGPGCGPQAGGAGKAYTIADGTTPVYYAGGGGGQIFNGGGATTCNGGQGGGGGGTGPGAPVCHGKGEANKGGGGGGGSSTPSPIAVNLKGGKGIVIVRY
jgi:hypothetical protein